MSLITVWVFFFYNKDSVLGFNRTHEFFFMGGKRVHVILPKPPVNTDFIELLFYFSSYHNTVAKATTQCILRCYPPREKKLHAQALSEKHVPCCSARTVNIHLPACGRTSSSDSTRSEVAQ